MRVTFKENCAVVTAAGQFDPEHVFENGQAFRFADRGGYYEGVAYGRFLRVSKRDDAVILYPVTPREYADVWEDYFDLRRDYASLFSDCADEPLFCARRFARGLRVLNQQPFELLISAIVSANNNLKRIKSIVEKICAACGEPFLAEGRRFYRFPVPERLAALTEEELLDCGCGYRAPYILASARAVADGFDLEKVGMLPYGQAKAVLCPAISPNHPL